MIAPNTSAAPPDASRTTRVVILGAGFGGIYTALHLQRLCRGNPHVAITLVSRDNYFLMTPLLFEAGSGVLEPRHAVTPVRAVLRRTLFVEAEVTGIDLDQRKVLADHEPATRNSSGRGGRKYELPYDHLVLALGGVTNRRIIPGSERALAFKTLADAIYLRNHIIDLFEQANIESDPARKRELLTFVIIGAGLVGMELMGELTEFVNHLCDSYTHIEATEVRYYLLEAADKVLPEMDADLGTYAAETLKRRGVDIRVNTPVKEITPVSIRLPDGTELCSQTIVLAAGVTANPLLASLPLAKGKGGRIPVEATMRHGQRGEVWALGDCALIPNPEGTPYPPLAQHALREARVLAHNIHAVISGRGTLRPFVYQSLGTLASLGHYSGVGRVWKFKVKGFVAWWVWRTYYVLQLPRLERRVRVIMDWTIALLFRHDIVKLDLFGLRHPRDEDIPATPENPQRQSAASSPPQSAAGDGSRSAQ